MIPFRRLAFASMLALPVAGVSCSSSEHSASRLSVTSTDSTCKVARTSLHAGRYQLDVTNDGAKVTEVYVYGPRDKVVGEVENIGPATSRSLSVTLEPGTYQLACKPGMTGRGIRTALTVSEADD